jgi:hypothetical protein
MRQRKRLILRTVYLLSLALCALLVLQAARIVPPAGVSWGDGGRGHAYSFQIDGSIVFQTLSGVKVPPRGIISFTEKRVGVVGFHYYRYSIIILAPDEKPLPGVYGTHAELRIALGWPVLFSLVCLVLVVNQRRMAASGQYCRHCGYDLRATPDRCPECGHASSAP